MNRRRRGEHEEDTEEQEPQVTPEGKSTAVQFYLGNLFLNFTLNRFYVLLSSAKHYAYGL